jgi:hypothetical protein
MLSAVVRPADRDGIARSRMNNALEQTEEGAPIIDRDHDTLPPHGGFLPLFLGREVIELGRYQTMRMSAQIATKTMPLVTVRLHGPGRIDIQPKFSPRLQGNRIWTRSGIKAVAAPFASSP